MAERRSGRGSTGWQVDPEADGTLTLGQFRRVRAIEDRRRGVVSAFAQLRAARPAAGSAQQVGAAVGAAAGQRRVRS